MAVNIENRRRPTLESLWLVKDGRGVKAGHNLVAQFVQPVAFITVDHAKVLEPGWITDRQIEASRVAMTRFIKRGGKIWIRLFPDKPVTKKPAETRMGKGKGAPDHWVAVVRPGRILFEMEGVTVAEAKEAMRLASHKMPLRTTFVQREML